MNNPDELIYSLHRWPHGWVVSSPVWHSGVSLEALEAAAKILGPDARLSTGIVHHLIQSRREPRAVYVIATREELTAWKQEIGDWLARRFTDPKTHWWWGIDVGKSSAAIFAVLAGPDWVAARCFAEAATPLDADDFGRCQRLLALFPEWRARLNEVALVYPQTRWPEVVSRWAELESANSEEQTELLQKLNAR